MVGPQVAANVDLGVQDGQIGLGERFPGLEYPRGSGMDAQVESGHVFLDFFQEIQIEVELGVLAVNLDGLKAQSTDELVPFGPMDYLAGDPISGIVIIRYPNSEPRRNLVKRSPWARPMVNTSLVMARGGFKTSLGPDLYVRPEKPILEICPYIPAVVFSGLP